nr:hypothetical protein [Bacilli bacterium]
SQELFAGQNEGMFEGIVPNETYTVTVAQEGLLGSTIYEESFVAVNNWSYDEFFGIYIDPEADFESCTFNATLQYEDTSDRFSDFELVLIGEEQCAFHLEKTYEVQTVSFESGQIEPGVAYTYLVNYSDNGEKKTYQGDTITFEGKQIQDEGVQIEVSGYAYAGSEAEGNGPRFPVTLYYDDSNGFYSDFSLTLTNPDGVTATHALAATQDDQIVFFEDGFLNQDSMIDGVTCQYAFRYYNANKQTYEETSGEVTFTFAYIEANYDFAVDYVEMTTNVSVDIVDYGYSFLDLKFRLSRDSDPSSAAIVDLDRTVEVQTLSVTDLGEIYAGETYTASILYTYHGSEEELVLGSQEITDDDPTVFNGINFETEFDYPNRTCSLRLDMVDPRSNYTDFTLSMGTLSGDGYEIEASLEHTDELQTFTFPEDFALNAEGMTLTYVLYWTDIRDGTEMNIDGQVTLVDSDYVTSDPAISGVSFDNAINYATGKFDVGVSYSDPDSKLESMSFVLIEQEGFTEYDFPLELSEDTQTLTWRDFALDETIREHSFLYAVDYVYGGETHRYSPELTSFLITNSGTSSYNGAVSPWYIIEDYTYLKLDITNDSNLYSSPSIRLVNELSESDALSETYLGNSGEGIDEWNYVYLGDSSVEAGVEYSLIVSAYEEGATSPVTIQEAPEYVTLVDGSSVSEITGIRLNSKSLSSSGQLDFTPYFTSVDGLSAFNITFYGESLGYYEFPFDLADWPSRGNYASIDIRAALCPDGSDLSAYEAFAALLLSEPIDVGFSYFDANDDSHTVVEYEDAFFTD